MTILYFDERLLRTQLDQLPQEHRAAFAAACAERLFPAYLHFSQTARKAYPEKLRAALSRLWDDLTGNPMSEPELRAIAKECDELIPSEEDEASDEQPYGEDAAAALAYALEARFKGSQEAVWSASRVYEALDHFVDFRNGDGIRATPEQQILEDPLVQAELARQSRDLEELLSLRGQEVGVVAARLRDRAKQEPAIAFDHAAEAAGPVVRDQSGAPRDRLPLRTAGRGLTAMTNDDFKKNLLALRVAAGCVPGVRPDDAVITAFVEAFSLEELEAMNLKLASLQHQRADEASTRRD